MRRAQPRKHRLETPDFSDHRVDFDARVTPLLEVLGKLREQSPSAAGGFSPFFSLEWDRAQLTMASPLVFTSHQAMPIVPLANALGAGLAGLATVCPQDKITFVLSLPDRTNKAVRVNLLLDELRPLSIGAKSLRVSLKNLAALSDRLIDAAELADARDQDVAQFQVERRGCHVKKIWARSPREAALKYGCLYVRSYREARNWKRSVREIRQLSHVIPREGWLPPK